MVWLNKLIVATSVPSETIHKLLRSIAIKQENNIEMYINLHHTKKLNLNVFFKPNYSKLANDCPNLVLDLVLELVQTF